jgi:hypothetical protein
VLWQVSTVEEYLHFESKLIPKTLVMLHTNPTPELQPTGTRKWIESRKGVQRHVQVCFYAIADNTIYCGISAPVVSTAVVLSCLVSGIVQGPNAC